MYHSVLSKYIVASLDTYNWGISTHKINAIYGNLSYTFVDMLQWPHGSSLIVTVLLKTLHDYQKIMSYLPICIFKWIIPAGKGL